MASTHERLPFTTSRLNELLLAHLDGCGFAETARTLRAECPLPPDGASA